MSRSRFAVVTLLVGLFAYAGPVSSSLAQVNVPPHSFEDVLETAQQEDTPILVEIYAPWCPYCQRMQEDVYSDATVRDYIDENFIYVRLNSDTTAGTHRYADRTLSTKQLASALGAKGVPTTTFLEADGSPIARQPGFIKRPMFLTMIRYVGSGAYRDQSFQEFADS